jgi:predicted small lipoprotein YifL
MSVLRVLLLILIVSLLGACGVKGTYSPPRHDNNHNKYTVTLNRPYDEVWKSLIQYSASEFFAIDNYEKDSGLITLDFGASSPSEFITGGDWTFTAPNFNFAGDYVEFMEKYRNASLNGRMNIVVIPIDDSTTRVSVNARYIFTVPSNQYSPGDTFSFDTGACKTKTISNAASGTVPSRTLCPTYKAEEAILKALR